MKMNIKVLRFWMRIVGHACCMCEGRGSFKWKGESEPCMSCAGVGYFPRKPLVSSRERFQRRAGSYLRLKISNGRSSAKRLLRVMSYRLSGRWHKPIKNLSDLGTLPCGTYVLPERRVFRYWFDARSMDRHANVECARYGCVSENRMTEPEPQSQNIVYQREDGKWVWIGWSPLKELTRDTLVTDMG